VTDLLAAIFVSYNSAFLDFSWTVTLCLSRGFSLALVIAHVCYLQRKCLS